MVREAGDLLAEALQLPVEARAALATSLISSLEDEVDEDVEAAWSVEILRRLNEVDVGAVKLIPWAEARRQIFNR